MAGHEQVGQAGRPGFGCESCDVLLCLSLEMRDTPSYQSFQSFSPCLGNVARICVQCVRLFVYQGVSSLPGYLACIPGERVPVTSRAAPRHRLPAVIRRALYGQHNAGRCWLCSQHENPLLHTMYISSAALSSTTPLSPCCACVFLGSITAESSSRVSCP